MRIDVVNRPSMAQQLVPVLPRGWTITECTAVTPSPEPGFVLLWEPSREAVAQARRQRPHGEVVALLDRRSPPTLVSEAMEGGAAVCIRDPVDLVVIGYLRRLAVTRFGMTEQTDAANARPANSVARRHETVEGSPALS